MVKNGFYKKQYIHEDSSFWEECYYKNGKKHGIEKVYDTDNFFMSQTTYVNGIKHGTEKHFVENNPVSEFSFYKGKLHGYAKTFDNDGSISSCVPYDNGKKHGIAKNLSCYRELYVNDVKILSADKNITKTSKYQNKICPKIYLSLCKLMFETKIYCENLKNKTIKIIPDEKHTADFYDWMVANNDISSIWNKSMINRLLRLSNIRVLDIVKKISQLIITEKTNKENILKSAEILAVSMSFLQKYDINYVKKYLLNNYNFFSSQTDNISDFSDENIPLIALNCFLKSTTFEDVINNVTSLKKHNYSVLLISGTLAQIYYKIPANLDKAVTDYFNEGLVKIWQQLNQSIYFNK